MLFRSIDVSTGLPATIKMINGIFYARFLAEEKGERSIQLFFVSLVWYIHPFFVLSSDAQCHCPNIILIGMLSYHPDLMASETESLS